MADPVAERNQSSATRSLVIVLAAGAAWTVLSLTFSIYSGALVVRSVGADFLCFWVASKGAADGAAPALYDWSQLRPMIEHYIGHGFDGFLPWKYPPIALLVFMPLALLSEPAAHLVWALSTFGLLLFVIYRIAGRMAVLAAIAAPLTPPEILMGQNGSATAAALGMGLLLCDRRRFLAGMFFGLLACKPQLCVMLPVALLMRRDWRTIAGAATSAIALVIASIFVHGPATWVAFLNSLRGNAAAFAEGSVPWSAIQSAYAATRALGGRPDLAFAVQTIVTVAAVAAVVAIERRTSSNALKSAAICAATVLATPFILVYDLTVLGVGMAFLAREASFHRGLSTVETIALLGIALSPALFLVSGVSVGHIDAAILMALAYRRCPRADNLAGEVADGAWQGATP